MSMLFVANSTKMRNTGKGFTDDLALSMALSLGAIFFILVAFMFS
jgi:hypothetical protein